VRMFSNRQGHARAFADDQFEICAVLGSLKCCSCNDTGCETNAFKFFERIEQRLLAFGWMLVGPMALKLRPDLIEGVERSLCFRFNIWPWQLMAKMDTKVVCRSLETGKRYRFLAKKEIEAMQADTSDACNTHSYKQIRLIR
jgi:hypothetical protein